MRILAHIYFRYLMLKKIVMDLRLEMTHITLTDLTVQTKTIKKRLSNQKSKFLRLEWNLLPNETLQSE